MVKISSVANRIQLSFAAAVFIVLLIGFLSFYYLNQLNRGLERIVERDIRAARLTEEIKNSLFDVYQQERLLPVGEIPPAQLEKMRSLLLSLPDLVREAKTLSSKEANIARYDEMTRLATESLEFLDEISRSTDLVDRRERLRRNLGSFVALSREALQARYQDLDKHQLELDRLSSNAQRNMIIVMLVLLVSAVGLGFVAPRIVSNPFKKMARAIEQVQAGNLEARIPVETDDELGEIAVALNKMLGDIRTFDQMKIRRIAFERRRFETLANMVDYGVILLKREGEVEFINSQLYVLFNLPSHEVEGKKLEDVPLPQEIKELCEECLLDMRKVEGREIAMALSDREGGEVNLALVVDAAMVRAHDGRVVNIILTLEEKSESGRRFLVRHAGIPSDAEEA
ncbi:HAMP domain-containing protein [Deltaproteobacteria bacterium PRO3]|nr:HAMP domain-containing protein [Deltaproteobacteria bacterium PRO3]